MTSITYDIYDTKPLELGFQNTHNVLEITLEGYTRQSTSTSLWIAIGGIGLYPLNSNMKFTVIQNLTREARKLVMQILEKDTENTIIAKSTLFFGIVRSAINESTEIIEETTAAETWISDIIDEKIEEAVPSDDHIAEIVADNIPSADITANTDARHTHTNKSVLDGITAQKIAQWDAGGGSSVIATINQDESMTVSDLVELADGLYYLANPIDGFVWFSGLIQVEDGYITVFNLGQMVGELNDDGYTFDYSVSVDGFGSTEMIGASDGQVLTYDADEGKAVFKDPTGGGSGSSYTFSTNSVATEGDGAILFKANDGSSTQTVSLRPPYTRINTGDCDNLINNGWYYVVSAVANRPITGTGAFYIMVGGNTVNLFQIAVNYSNNDMYKRSHTTQGWTKWKRFANDMWRLYDTIEFTEQTNPVIYTFPTPVKEFYIQTNAYVGSNIGYMYPNSGTLYVGVHGGTANNFHMYHCYILEGKYVVCESCTGGSNATGLQRAVREMTISEFSSFKFAGDVPSGAKWHVFTKEI